MDWNAELYEGSHRFVADCGASLVELVAAGGETLDLGCGTGGLTEALRRVSSRVVGVDSSPSMIEKARALHPGENYRVADACNLPFVNRFDTVFANAVFHWIADQQALLTSVGRALKPGGRLVAEFGARGNVARIEAAFAVELQGIGIRYASPFYFPEREQYRAELERAQFLPLRVEVFSRPTPLDGGAAGLGNWMRQFFAGTLHTLPTEQAEGVLRGTEDRLRPVLFRGGRWVADYRRIRVVAETKKS